MRRAALFLALSACTRFGESQNGDVDAGLADVVDASEAGNGGDASPRGPIAFVQAAAVQDVSGNAVATFDVPVGAHHAVVAAFAITSAQVSTVTVSDTLLSTYALAVGPSKDTNGHVFFLYAAVDVPGGGSNAVTVSTEGVAATVELYIGEYTNVRAFDVGAFAFGPYDTNVDAMNSGAVITKEANELVVGFGLTGTAAAGTGFTARSTLHGNILEDQIAGPPGTYSATATTSAGVIGWGMLAATFTAR